MSKPPLEITPSRVPDDLLAVQQLVNQQAFDAATTALETLQKQRPHDALVQVFLAMVARLDQRLPQAAAHIAQALASNPDFFPAWIERARIARADQQPLLAIESYARAHALLPQAVDGLMEWHETLFEGKQYAEALTVIERLDALQPGHIDTRMKLGVALQHLHRHADAATVYAPLLPHAALYPHLINNLAAALMLTGRHDDAQDLLQREVEDHPDNAMARVNLSTLLKAQFDLDGAQAALESACALAPAYAVAHNNLGLLLKERAQWDAAEASLRQAIALDAAYDGARWNLAMLRLLQGDFAEGWPLHEARWAGAPELAQHQPVFAQPAWQGQPLAGQTLLLWAEQGMGDTLQFVRYLPRLAARVHTEGGRLLFSAPRALHALLHNSFSHLLDGPLIDDTTPPPAHDLHCPLLSLPLQLGLGAADMAVPVPYLQPTAAAAQHWQHTVAGERRVRVGLAWSGSRTHQRNPLRAVDVEAFTRFSDVPGVAFYNLQFDAGDELATARNAGLALVDFTPELRDYNDSAALLLQMDLVISVCTSTAHLAGALGVPCWVPLDVNPHWVWLLDRDDSPWYPHTRLFRQTQFHEWEAVLQRLHSGLRALAADAPARA